MATFYGRKRRVVFGGTYTCTYEYAQTRTFDPGTGFYTSRTFSAINSAFQAALDYRVPGVNVLDPQMSRTGGFPYIGVAIGISYNSSLNQYEVRAGASTTITSSGLEVQSVLLEAIPVPLIMPGSVPDLEFPFSTSHSISGTWSIYYDLEEYWVPEEAVLADSELYEMMQDGYPAGRAWSERLDPLGVIGASITGVGSPFVREFYPPLSNAPFHASIGIPFYSGSVSATTGGWRQTGGAPDTIAPLLGTGSASGSGTVTGGGETVNPLPASASTSYGSGTETGGSIECPAGVKTFIGGPGQNYQRTNATSWRALCRSPRQIRVKATLMHSTGQPVYTENAAVTISHGSAYAISENIVAGTLDRLIEDEFRLTIVSVSASVTAPGTLPPGTPTDEDQNPPGPFPIFFIRPINLVMATADKDRLGLRYSRLSARGRRWGHRRLGHKEIDPVPFTSITPSTHVTTAIVGGNLVITAAPPDGYLGQLYIIVNDAQVSAYRHWRFRWRTPGRAGRIRITRGSIPPLFGVSWTLHAPTASGAWHEDELDQFNGDAPLPLAAYGGIAPNGGWYIYVDPGVTEIEYLRGERLAWAYARNTGRPGVTTLTTNVDGLWHTGKVGRSWLETVLPPAGDKPNPGSPIWKWLDFYTAGTGKEEWWYDSQQPDLEGGGGILRNPGGGLVVCDNQPVDNSPPALDPYLFACDLYAQATVYPGAGNVWDEGGGRGETVFEFGELLGARLTGIIIGDDGTSGGRELIAVQGGTETTRGEVDMLGQNFATPTPALLPGVHEARLDPDGPPPQRLTLTIVNETAGGTGLQHRGLFPTVWGTRSDSSAPFLLAHPELTYVAIAWTELNGSALYFRRTKGLDPLDNTRWEPRVTVVSVPVGLQGSVAVSSPCLYLEPGGQLVLRYTKLGPPSGIAIMERRSDDEGSTWSTEAEMAVGKHSFITPSSQQEGVRFVGWFEQGRLLDGVRVGHLVGKRISEGDAWPNPPGDLAGAIAFVQWDSVSETFVPLEVADDSIGLCQGFSPQGYWTLSARVVDIVTDELDDEISFWVSSGEPEAGVGISWLRLPTTP